MTIDEQWASAVRSESRYTVPAVERLTGGVAQLMGTRGGATAAVRITADCPLRHLPHFAGMVNRALVKEALRGL